MLDGSAIEGPYLRGFPNSHAVSRIGNVVIRFLGVGIRFPIKLLLRELKLIPSRLYLKL